MADPYLATLNALNSGPPQTVYVDNTDYAGMRRANERAAQAEADLKAAKERSAVEYTKTFWVHRLSAAEGQVIQSDLNYRAWRAVAEAVEDGMAQGMFERPIERPPESLVLRHYQSLVAQRKTAPGLDRDTSKQLALVERWRLMGRAMHREETMELLPDDLAEGALNYYKFSGMLHNGTGAVDENTDTMVHEHRRPGMVVNVTQSGLRALNELRKKGLMPPGLERAVAEMAERQEAYWKRRVGERGDEAQSHQRKLDELAAQRAVLEARQQALETAQKEQSKRGPGWFGKAAWVEAMGKTTDDLAQVKEALVANHQAAERHVADRDLALGRGRWCKARLALDVAHTVALVLLDEEIAKNPSFMAKFEGAAPAPPAPQSF